MAFVIASISGNMANCSVYNTKYRFSFFSEPIQINFRYGANTHMHKNHFEPNSNQSKHI